MKARTQDLHIVAAGRHDNRASVTNPSDDRVAGAEGCAACGARLAPSQRYCLACGARRGPLPAAVGERVDALRADGRADPAGAESPPVSAVDPEAGDEAGAEDEKSGYWRFMPSAEIAAVAVMVLLAAGVVLGSVTSPIAASAGFAPIIFEMGPSSGESASPPAEVAAPSAGQATAPPLASASTAPVPVAPEVPVAAPVEPEPTPKPLELPPELSEEEELPDVKHVFLIVLEGHGYEEAFGATSAAPYFAQTLAGQGELLPNYYAVTQGGLANEIALLSGQGPTPETAGQCPEYTPIAPAPLGADGQLEGSGCVYPAETPTLPGQLIEAKMTWKAYVEGLVDGCAHEEASPNPLLYFAALAQAPECAKRDVGLDRLDADLKVARKTPTLSYIVPNACHDGGEIPCAAEAPTGLAGAAAFLETVIPKITASQAYKEGGLIALTFDQAPQEGPNADSSSCCATPEYPNLPAPATPPPTATGPVKPSGGGGRVGLLLISPFIEAASVNESVYYNHFSLLLSIEELLGLPPLGYAAGPALSGFESEIFNAAA